MKRGLLTATLALSIFTGSAQTITDTVSVGSPSGSGINYPNQVWYSLPNDMLGYRERNEWDIAFDMKSITSGVMINSAGGVMLWKYPKGNLSGGWAMIDTFGMSASWTPRYNSDTAWALSAIGRYADPGNPNNLDWGTYNSTTHTVNGDSLYIIKLANGQYKKFAIESLIGGVFTFKYANLDGTSAQTQTLSKVAYPGKNFAYFNLATNTAQDREPLAENWDLLFTQYTTFLPAPYGVTGVLLNRGVKAVKVSGLPDVATNTNYSGQTFSSQINTIGYNWKSFNGSAYVIKDSQLYFVKRVNGDIWKLVFTGFGGAATGDFMFSKEKLYSAPTGIASMHESSVSLTVYPNPSAGRIVHVIYDLESPAQNARLSVHDISGRMVAFTALPEATMGLHQYQLPTESLKPGAYLISLEAGSERAQQMLIIQ